MPTRTSAKETGAAGRLEILTKNNCLPDRVYRAGAEEPLVMGGFLPIPVALAAEAERLALLVSGGAGAEDLGSAALVAVADLDRVQCLNVIGWLQPQIGPDNRLRVTDGAPPGSGTSGPRSSGGQKARVPVDSAALTKYTL